MLYRKIKREKKDRKEKSESEKTGRRSLENCQFHEFIKIITFLL